MCYDGGDKYAHLMVDAAMERNNPSTVTVTTSLEGTVEELAIMLGELPQQDPSWWKILNQAAARASYNIGMIGDAELDEVLQDIEETDVERFLGVDVLLDFEEEE